MHRHPAWPAPRATLVKRFNTLCLFEDFARIICLEETSGYLVQFFSKLQESEVTRIRITHRLKSIFLQLELHNKCCTRKFNERYKSTLFRKD